MSENTPVSARNATSAASTNATSGDAPADHTVHLIGNISDGKTAFITAIAKYFGPLMRPGNAEAQVNLELIAAGKDARKTNPGEREVYYLTKAISSAGESTLKIVSYAGEDLEKHGGYVDKKPVWVSAPCEVLPDIDKSDIVCAVINPFWVSEKVLCRGLKTFTAHFLKKFSNLSLNTAVQCACDALVGRQEITVNTVNTAKAMRVFEVYQGCKIELIAEEQKGGGHTWRYKVLLPKDRKEEQEKAEHDIEDSFVKLATSLFEQRELEMNNLISVMKAKKNKGCHIMAVINRMDLFERLKKYTPDSELQIQNGVEVFFLKAGVSAEEYDPTTQCVMGRSLNVVFDFDRGHGKLAWQVERVPNGAAYFWQAVVKIIQQKRNQELAQRLSHALDNIRNHQMRLILLPAVCAALLYFIVVAALVGMQMADMSPSIVGLFGFVGFVAILLGGVIINSLVIWNPIGKTLKEAGFSETSKEERL